MVVNWIRIWCVECTSLSFACVETHAIQRALRFYSLASLMTITEIDRIPYAQIEKWFNLDNYPLHSMWNIMPKTIKRAVCGGACACVRRFPYYSAIYKRIRRVLQLKIKSRENAFDCSWAPNSAFKWWMSANMIVEPIDLRRRWQMLPFNNS